MTTKDVTQLRVRSKATGAEGVVVLELEAPDGERLRDWAPGAHIDVVLPGGLTRQYSLCGNRWDSTCYRIGVLREPTSRGGSTYVHDSLHVGDLVGVGGPRNNFPLVPSESYLFVAGGIGITPIIPMIQQVEMLGASWRLLYGGRRRSSMAFLPELLPYGSKVQVAPEDECGLLDLEAFLEEPDPDTKIYACGPDALLTAIESACSNWTPHSVRTERFVADLVGPPARLTPFEVSLARSNLSMTVEPDRSVLDALRASGVEVLTSCRQGTCGTCGTVVLDGVPEHRDAILEDHERAQNDYMFVCVSRALSDHLVLDL